MKRVIAGSVVLAAAASLAVADPFAGTFVRIGVCKDGGYGVNYNCPEFIQTPGLPAYDAAHGVMALPWSDYQGLDTVPSLEVREVSVADGKRVANRVLWSFGDSFDTARKIQKTNSPADIARVTKQLVALAQPFDRALADAGYVPVPRCTSAEADATRLQPYCPGFEKWTCGDLQVAYNAKHTGVSVTVHGKTRTFDARGWKKPPLKMSGMAERVETENCIAGAVRVPGTDKIFIELAHSCTVSGDWCDAGGPTWQAVF
ncbi:MAG TPA: hypothetical protein VGM88_23575 [Kofleriaceae bacterium]|jgi:hypothetical protein